MVSKLNDTMKEQKSSLHTANRKVEAYIVNLRYLVIQASFVPCASIKSGIAFNQKQLTQGKRAHRFVCTSVFNDSASHIRIVSVLASLLVFSFSLSLHLMTWFRVQQDGVTVCILLVVPLLDILFLRCSLITLQLHLLFSNLRFFLSVLLACCTKHCRQHLNQKG